LSESDPFLVEFSKDAKKDLKKYRSAAPLVGKAVARLAVDPELGEMLSGDLAVFRSLHIAVKGSGEFRAVYLIEADARVCLVFAIGPREGFYQSLKRRLGG
jgi:mRNA-degrading endonuclease RelE of RelBE toxin-antitoxin system